MQRTSRKQRTGSRKPSITRQPNLEVETKQLKHSKQAQGDSKGFLTTYVRVRAIKQKNFMLLVTETNQGLAYDRDVKVSFETFYDVISVAMVTKTLLKHTPQKSGFFFLNISLKLTR